jgi:hypothetical protein
MNKFKGALGIGAALSIAAFFLMQEPVEPRLDKITVFSWNILCRDCPSEIGTWEERRDEQLAFIQSFDTDVIALQEIQHDQFEWFTQALSENYNYCSPPVYAGERQVLFAKKHLALECREQIPLSELSNGSCDTAFIQGVKYFNCHFPTMAAKSPYEEIDANQLAMMVLEPYLDNEYSKVVLGDFNSTWDWYTDNKLDELMRCSHSNDPAQDIDKICFKHNRHSLSYRWEIGRSDHQAMIGRFYNHMPAVTVIINELILE